MRNNLVRGLVAVACAALAALALPRSLGSAERKVRPDCTYKGRRLYGKVKVVTNFPDLKVQIVDAFPDLKVQVVESFPEKCGLWKMVEAFPDLKVQFVDAFPDIKIKYVTSFPGIP